jgi:hypothetical protein
MDVDDSAVHKENKLPFLRIRKIDIRYMCQKH